MDLVRRFLNARILFFSLCVGLAIASAGFGVDFLVHQASRLYASDLYTFLVAFVFSYALMLYEKRRRAMLVRRMMIAAEVNHHIRNALTAVVFTASVQKDSTLQSVIEDATARINWVLETVLPDGEKEMKWPIQVPEWTAASWQPPKGEKRTGT